MEEIFEIIKAINRLSNRIDENSAKIDCLINKSSQQPASKYVEEEGACRILKISPRTLAKLRVAKKILYVKNGHKIQYLISDLYEYLTRNIKQ